MVRLFDLICKCVFAPDIMRGQEEAIVSKPEIVLYSKRVLHVLVKIIQIDVGEYLRGEVSDGSTFSNRTL